MQPRPNLAAALVAALAVTLLASVSAASPGASSPRSARVADCSSFLPAANKAYFNNPKIQGGETPQTQGNDIQDLFECDIAAAPRGSTIRVATWNMSDPTIADALLAAFRRGVRVQVVMARANCDDEAVRPLKRAVGTDHRRSSFLTCASGSARDAGPGTMHQKSITFTKVGSVDHVTLVGSANMTKEGYSDQWVDMFQYVERKDVFDDYNSVFELQKRDRNMTSPFRQFTPPGEKHGMWFFPVNTEAPTSADDPVYSEILSIPAGDATHPTTIRVATYAAHGSRADWLASALVSRHQAGARVRVLTGPPASVAFENRLRSAGIPVVHAFDSETCPVEKDDPDCDYIHLKLMTAKYWDGSSWAYRVWTGSDNWTNPSLNNDEVVQRIGGPAAYRQYQRFLATITRTYT
ncbi:MAG TPA: phospholipase D-like domain-containing protein [Nocardioides sp.]|nr:phospholipase D-like domain-containing protein [Nocardioides sp.]